jgi:8-oxo-dGTP diphosphatase
MSIPEYTLGFMFNATMTEVLLCRKSKPAWQAGKLNGIGGKIDGDETPEAAMIREFKEETGVYTSLWEHFATLRREHTDSRFIVHCFRSMLQISSLHELDFTAELDQPLVIMPVKSMSVDYANELLSNITWLVHMAADNAQHDGAPYTLDARIGVAHD